jgi:hypothetical protein
VTLVLLVLGLWAAWSGSLAEAAPLVGGTVTARNGAPLADVQVQVEIRTVRTAASTDAQGRFQLDAATLFSAGELRDAAGMMLKFSKPGFQPVNKLVRLRGQSTIGPVAVQLDVAGGSAELIEAERQALDTLKFTVQPGSAPVVLIPYALTGITVPDPKNVNELLAANLQRVIVTHLQAAGAPPVVLKLLALKQVNDLDRLRAYGSYLNALGVISGYGAVEAARSGPPSLGVSSTFLVVPHSAGGGAPVLYVDDDIPADRLASPRLYQHLSKLWGRSTVLALGLSEFDRARAKGHQQADREALRRIARYLQAERGNAGPGDEALVSEVKSLLDAIEKELAR